MFIFNNYRARQFRGVRVDTFSQDQHDTIIYGNLKLRHLNLKYFLGVLDSLF